LCRLKLAWAPLDRNRTELCACAAKIKYVDPHGHRRAQISHWNQPISEWAKSSDLVGSFPPISDRDIQQGFGIGRSTRWATMLSTIANLGHMMDRPQIAHTATVTVKPWMMQDCDRAAASRVGWHAVV
jgi:hypothetical protein